MTDPSIPNMSSSQRERLAYIDFRLYFFGEIGRPDLIKHFGVAPAGATRDLALYRKCAPQNISFDGSNKIYRISQNFSPLFEHSLPRVLSVLVKGFGYGIDALTEPLLPFESPTSLSHPKINVLAALCRAIKANQPVAIRYYSMSSGETERIIVPFALIDTGLRWHVRAFDRKHGEFRDFVLTRIESPILIDEQSLMHERSDKDIQWTRIVELDLVPHPRLIRPEIIKMDYGMTGDSLYIKARAAVVGYMLQCWSVDCSSDHHLTDEQYRLWLSDPLVLYGVQSATLAPGYQAPASIKNQ